MFTLPDLPYAYNALEPFIDEETMHIHHDKHHAAYVRNLNDVLSGHTDLLKLPVESLIGNLSQIPEDIRTKVKNFGGGHANHTFFWDCMSGTKDQMPKGALAEAIEKTFTSFVSFQEQFTKTALSRFGSGWAWLVLDKEILTITDTANQDSPFSEGAIPLLTLDVWEHAYYLKYRQARADYIANWWHVVNWTGVANRFSK